MINRPSCHESSAPPQAPSTALALGCLLRKGEDETRAMLLGLFGEEEEAGKHQAALDNLYAEIYRAAIAIARHSQDAEDLTQGAFLTILEMCKQGEAFYRHPAALMRTIVRRDQCDDDRKQDRRRNVPLGDNAAQLAAPEDCQPHHVVESAETMERVKRAVATLSEDLAMFYELHWVRGLSIRASARVLGITEGQAHRRNANLTAKFRELLKELG